ncbi:hypothetical protein D3C85_1228150 [compost metagenome]
MISKASESPTDATIYGVAQNATPAWFGAVDPNTQLVLANIVVQIKVRDTGLYDCKVAPIIDGNHTLHTFKIDDHRSGVARC